MGGTVDDTELIEGLVFTQKASRKAGGPSRIANAKIALLQFCISPPKTDVSTALSFCVAPAVALTPVRGEAGASGGGA